MQTKHLCVLIHIWTKGEVGAPLNRFKPSSKIYYWPFQGGTSFVDLLCFSVLCLLCLCARLFICALWPPAGKGLTSWLSIVVSNCEFVTFPLVSWVRCGSWLYRFLIFTSLLTLSLYHVVSWVRCGTWFYRFLIFATFLTSKMFLVQLNPFTEKITFSATEPWTKELCWYFWLL